MCSLTLVRLLPACANSKPHYYTKKMQKMRDLPKTWVISEKPLSISDQKKKSLLLILQIAKQSSGTKRSPNKQGPCNQEWKIKKLENSFHIKTVGTFARLELKKSSPDKINFYVLSARHDMYTVASEAAKFKPTSHSPSVLPHFGGNILWKLSNLLSEEQLMTMWLWFFMKWKI